MVTTVPGPQEGRSVPCGAPGVSCSYLGTGWRGCCLPKVLGAGRVPGQMAFPREAALCHAGL